MRSSVLFFLFSAFQVGLNAKAKSFTEGEEIGLLDEYGTSCIRATLHVNLINMNINRTDNRIPFDLLSPETKIGGRCAKDHGGEPIFTASNSHSGRDRKIYFYFAKNTVRVKNVDELRWQLKSVVYEEYYADKSAKFESDNSSIIISAPLNQKYVCKDRITITLYSEGYKEVMVEFLPEIDVQPFGPRSNFYLCERTRKRTLRESFENKATITSGVVLGLAAVGSMVGHAVRRHTTPSRKQFYESLGK